MVRTFNIRRSEGPNEEHPLEWMFVCECPVCGERVVAYIKAAAVRELAADKKIGYVSERAVINEIGAALEMHCPPKKFPSVALQRLTYAPA